MVRIAVRTLTLNVYKGSNDSMKTSFRLFFIFVNLVPDSAMHRFILDRTATQYFSNLVWFIRKHIIDFDAIIRNDRE